MHINTFFTLLGSKFLKKESFLYFFTNLSSQLKKYT